MTAALLLVQVALVGRPNWKGIAVQDMHQRELIIVVIMTQSTHGSVAGRVTTRAVIRLLNNVVKMLILKAESLLTIAADLMEPVVDFLVAVHREQRVLN